MPGGISSSGAPTEERGLTCFNVHCHIPQRLSLWTAVPRCCNTLPLVPVPLRGQVGATDFRVGPCFQQFKDREEISSLYF